MLSLCSPVPSMFPGTYVPWYLYNYVPRYLCYPNLCSGNQWSIQGGFLVARKPPPAMIFFKIRGFTSLQADLSQFKDFFAKMRLPPGLRPGPRWGAYSAPQTPSWKALDQANNEPPLSKSWLRACIHHRRPLLIQTSSPCSCYCLPIGHTDTSEIVLYLE